MQQPTKIGILDSGVGGLSIYSAVAKHFPAADVVYLADRKNFPFYVKSNSALRSIAESCVIALRRLGCTVIVIACNTLSIHATAWLRERFASIQFVGIEPPLPRAIRMSKLGGVAILSTPATQRSARLRQLIRASPTGVRIYNCSSAKLSLLIEAGDLHSKKVSDEVHQRLSSIPTGAMDTLVLGCTHFPFALDAIKTAVSSDVQILTQDFELIERLQMLIPAGSTANRTGSRTFLSTFDPSEFSAVASKLLCRSITAQALGREPDMERA